MKATFLLLFLSALSVTGISGPPTLEFDTRTSAFSGRYRYEVRNQKPRSGTVELRIQFAPLPEAATPTATFGNTSFRVTAVALIIDGKAQKFSSELLESLGFCTPEAVFFHSDDRDGLLMVLDFSAGKEVTTLPFEFATQM